MTRVRLGAVGYLNARPLVFGLGGSTFDVARVGPELTEGAKRFGLRFDVPSKCAELLHEQAIDVGMIPSIEYQRNPAAVRGQTSRDDYLIVPDLAIASRGPVASVALFTRRPIQDVRSIAMDTSSRTSVALTRVLCARHFRIEPRFEPHGPNLDLMLAHCDAALVIGDNALFQPAVSSPPSPPPTGSSTLSVPAAPPVSHASAGLLQSAVEALQAKLAGTFPIEKIDLGEAWTEATGLPFVWAFWAGRRGALTPADVAVLRLARDTGVSEAELIAREYFAGAADAVERQRIGARYLQDNIKYDLGTDQRAGLALFYRYAEELGLVGAAEPLRFFEEA